MNLTRCRSLVILATAALFSASQARPSVILTYTGDPNGKTSYGDYQDLSGTVNIAESQVFQDFTVSPGSTWNVRSLFVNETDLGPSNVTEATWSIRTGMGPGNGGTTVYSGTSAATEGSGNISQVTVGGLNITLPPGQYWMNITPQTSGTKLLEDTTNGMNSLNAVLTQSGLWFESGYENYTPVMADFSIGIDGTLVVASTPEPASWALMATALVGFAIFWKMRAIKQSAVAVRVERSNRGWQK